ncbi:MAG TPA: YeeE/YedE thiosulfate transporter family protein [Lentimicrobium sp.]|nr:YeeE/YedE thiosulfate transporter family protein [Lentimicrobium sp.]
MKRDGSFYLNPYLGGIMLGLVLFATYYITGRGLGASGAVKSTVVTTVHAVSPEHAEKSAYYSKFLSDDSSPMNNWLVFEVLGVIAGAFFSGALWGRLKIKTEHSPKISSKTRLIAALIGGAFFGMGSQLARGCTSGAALSGMAVLSSSGIITMMAIFGSAYLFSWIFKRLWI